MNDDLTLICVVVDRSGSMGHIAEDMSGGLNQFLKEQAAEPGECRVTLAQFDTEFEMIHDYAPINTVAEYQLHARGGTALWDAIGRTISHTGERLAALPEAERPGKILCVIITDGLENSSVEYRGGVIKSMITELQNEYGWVFTYLGANQDAIAVGESMGVSANNSMTYAASAMGTHSMAASLSSNTTRLRNTGTFDSYSGAQRAAAVEEPATVDNAMETFRSMGGKDKPDDD